MWWKCEVPSAHVGAGKFVSHYNYVWAKDAASALEKLNQMRGWRKFKLFGVKKKSSVPRGVLSVEPLTKKEAKILEQEIVKRIPLAVAKKYGYYGRRKDV